MENGINAWEKVQLARDKERPYAADYIEEICDEFMELHGDRLSGDDGALIGGIGRIDSYYVTILAQQKGRSVKQNMKRNFGMVSPEGYRKAVRLARMSEKFHRPILCLVDTPGAFCGIESGRERTGRSDCADYLSNVRAESTDSFRGHRRRRQRRRTGACGSGCGLHGRKRSLFDPISRRVRLDSVEGQRQGGRSGRTHENDRAGTLSDGRG